jgi:hypothetical protein
LPTARSNHVSEWVEPLWRRMLRSTNSSVTEAPARTGNGVAAYGSPLRDRFRVPGSTYQPQADVLRRQSYKLRWSKRTGRNGPAYASAADFVPDRPDG